MKQTLVTAIALVGFAFAAYAQQSPPPDTAPPPAPPPAAAPSGPPQGGPPPGGQSAPGGQPAPAANIPQANTKPVDCIAKARSQGLRGPAVRVAVQICREEQRLACLKEAVERKIGGPARRDFVLNCAGRPGGGGGPRGRGRGGEPDDNG
jgi:hypothetical protein